ncbi:MAG: hypothetical protein J6D18_05220 [Erysipelotrichaceae bacterium]|nr:hypothetical protein [Erysipelotrichaceae bacterium]
MTIEKTYVLLRNEEFKTIVEKFLSQFDFVSDVVIDDIDLTFDFNGTTEELNMVESNLDGLWLQYQQQNNGFTFS